jgi:hypothetical protein
MIKGTSSAVVAGAILLALTVAGCAAASGATPDAKTAVQAAASGGFVGYKWEVTSITHDGQRTPIPASLPVYLLFTPNGTFGANDAINFASGTYHPTGTGFTTGTMGGTGVGYAGSDPTMLAAINAIGAFNAPGAAARAHVAGDQLSVSVGGYLLDCRRDGAQRNFPPARPT